MARITDQNRVERLKESTMKLVVEKGFGGASAALIAKDAKVAAGYFYLHYHGKYEMVNSLLHSVYQEFVDRLEELILQASTFEVITKKLINHFFNMAINEPVKLKFLYVLTNDYSFVIDPEVKKKTFQFITRLKEVGQLSETLDKNITDEDLYLFLVINTIQFINQRFKNSLDKVSFNEADEEHLYYLIQKILK
ncbi:MAG: TetR/AcrR family transcriptional regulator [Prolixibacteraceae bacterium]